MVAALPPLEIARAWERLAPVVHRTPLIRSSQLDQRAGRRVWLKLECLQRSGSFKARGAFNAALVGLEQGDRRGLACVSSGNHGQAVALAARSLDLEALVVMPPDASPVKVAAIRGYGAEVYSTGVTLENRDVICQQLAEQRRLRFIHPHDDPDVMAGQATVAEELVEQLGSREAQAGAVVIPVGGGGLLAGMASSLRERLPQALVVGVEPGSGDDAGQSLRRGTLVSLEAAPATLADGARTLHLGAGCWEIIRRLRPSMVSVDELDLARACWWLWSRAKLLVEPTGALALAAVLGRAQPEAAWHNALRGRGDLVCVISGGNCDPGQMRAVLALVGSEGESV